MVHFLETKTPHMYISLLQLRSKCSGGSKNPTTSEIELFETVLNFWKLLEAIFCRKGICFKFSWVPIPASYKICIQTMQYKI